MYMYLQICCICIDDCNRCNFYEVHLWKLNHWSKKTCLSRCLYFLIPYLPPFFLSDLVSLSPLVGKDNDTFLSCALNSFHTHQLLLFPRSFRVRNYVFFCFLATLIKLNALVLFQLTAIFAATSVARPRADVAYCIHALARRVEKTHNWAVSQVYFSNY